MGIVCISLGKPGLYMTEIREKNTCSREYNQFSLLILDHSDYIHFKKVNVNFMSHRKSLYSDF